MGLSIEDLDARETRWGAMGDAVANRGSVRQPNDSAGSSLRARIEAVVEDIISDHFPEGPDRQTAGNFARKELLKLYDHPKVSQLEATLLKRITEDEARHILFLPDHDQAKYYQALIADPPKGAPPEHPQHSLQIPHLSLLYLEHWKRWDFVSSFVLSGGLHTLCSLFTHANPIVRMKAITTLVSITAHRDFDWFTPAPRVRPVSTRRDEARGSAYANNTTEARLHRALLGLRLDPAFISGLIANSWGGDVGGSGGGSTDGTESEAVVDREKSGEGGGRRGEENTFPGGCLMCLELLAMWLSWVRALHTVDGTLRLSRPLFRAIEEWGGKDGRLENGLGSGQGPRLSALSHKEEQTLPKPCEDVGAAAEGEGDVPEEDKGGASTFGAVGATAVAEVNDPTTMVTAKENDPIAMSGLNDDAVTTMYSEGMKEERDTTTDGSGAGDDENEGQEGIAGNRKVGGTATTASVEAQSDDKEKGNMVLAIARAEREERAKVLELSEKLVADFGRFPPAEQEWEGVEEDSPRGEGETSTIPLNETMPIAPTAFADEQKHAGEGVQGVAETCSSSSSTDDRSASEGAISSDVSGDHKHVVANDEKHPSRGSDGGTSSRSETAQSAGDLSPSAALIQRALALKVEGNDYFRKGDLHAARDVYTTAIGVLDTGRAGVGAQKERVTEELDAREVEAAALCGVLHKNRAAVALRLFEAAAAAAAAAVAARNKKYTPASHGEGKSKNQGVRHRARAGGSAGGSAAAGGIDHHSKQKTSSTATGTEPASRRGKGGLSTGNPEGGGISEETASNERAALESSLVLLDGCESDCLKAIEMNAGDNKARRRLERSRELRRRCCRGGLAAATEDKAGYPTGYSRQDERLQDRKADLVAKILARGKGSHEVFGGSGGGKEEATRDTATATSPVPNTDQEGTNRGCVPSADSDVVTSGLADDDRVETGGIPGVDSGSTFGESTPREGPSVTEEGKGRSAPCAPDQKGANLAPREGGELKEEVARSPREATGPNTAGHPTTAANGTAPPAAGVHEHHEKGPSVSTVMPSRGTGRRGGAGLTTGLVERRKKTAASTKKVVKPGNRRNPEAFRSLHRRLERAAARAVAAAAAAAASTRLAHGEKEERGEEEADREEATAKEAWDVLRDISASSGDTNGGDEPVSLRRLFGDGITAESVAGIALGLRHACRVDPATNTQRASQLFLELARVKRVRLALAMCSAKDRGSLQDVWEHILHRHHGNPDPRLQPVEDSRNKLAVNGKGSGGNKKMEKGREEKGRGWLALKDAGSALGLQ